MSIISITRLYELLTSKLGKENAENLTTFIEDKIRIEVENKSQILATREDLFKVKSDLELKISESKSDTIKWMFIFWIGQVAVTFGFLLIYLKK